MFVSSVCYPRTEQPFENALLPATSLDQLSLRVRLPVVIRFCLAPLLLLVENKSALDMSICAWASGPRHVALSPLGSSLTPAAVIDSINRPLCDR